MMRTLDKQMFDDDKEEDDKCGKCYPTMCCCEDRNVYEWTWDENFASNISELSDRNLLVRFHPGFSNGTAAIKGNKLMEKGRHHYWEVKMLTQVYGTDVMIGVGTTKVDLNCRRNTFCSLLGCDRESWGFSYKGYLQHNGKIQDYSAPFEKGSLVGAHLDTWRGTLEFYLNRKPLGIAFTGLRDVELYPMICSTAAQSRIKLTYSNSMDASLQMDCLARLKPLHRAYLVAAFPGLRYLSKSVFADILQKRFDENYEEEEDLELPAEFMILDDFDFALVGLGRKRRKKHLERTEFDDLVPKRMLHFSP